MDFFLGKDGKSFAASIIKKNKNKWRPILLAKLDPNTTGGVPLSQTTSVR